MTKKNTENNLKQRIKLLAINFALVIVVIIVAIFIVNRWMHKFTRHGQSIEVPSVIGVRIDKAIDVLEEGNFRYEIIDSVYRDNLKKMDVAEQDPAAGSFVKKGRKVYLIVNSLDKPKVQVPRLQNKSINLAKVLLKNAGLKLGNVTTKKTTLGDGLVLAQFYRGDTLSPYSWIEKGAKIDLLISVKPGENDIMNEYGEYISPEDGGYFNDYD
jgi:beta-lactam-binding protein with PASTA domain